MIELKNVEKVYKTKKGVKTKALNNVNIKFREKGLVFILGKSGSGKSTLLNIIGGLDRETSGEVIIDSKSTKKFKNKDYDYYRNTYIGFIFQEFNLLEEYNVYDNILLSMNLQKKKFPKERVDKLLSNVGLEGLGSRRINELSGGQKQRVAIARAIVKKPEVILADEPTGSLDSKTGEEIFKLLKNISKEKLVIVVSHDEEAARKYGDEIIHIEDGKVLEEVKNYENTKEFKRVKSHLKVTKALKLSFMNLKQRKIRLFFTILLMTIALSFFGIAMIFTQHDEVYTHTKAMVDDNYDLIEIIKSDSYDYINKNYYRNGIQVPITENDIEKVENNVNGKIYKLNTLYEENEPLSFEFNYENLSSLNSYYLMLFTNGFSFIEYDDNDIKNNFIGKKPTEYDEIMIHSYLADYIMKVGALKYNSSEFKKDYYKPLSYEQIISDGMYLKLGSAKVKIVGIILDDNTKYEKFKNIKLSEIQKEPTNYLENMLLLTKDPYGYLEFTNKVLSRADEIYVKNGFIDNINIKANNDIDDIYKFNIIKDNQKIFVPGKLGYLDKKITIINLNKKEVIDKINNDEVVVNRKYLDMISNQDYTKKETEFINSYKKLLEERKTLEFKTDETLKEEFMMSYLKDNNIIGSKISFNINNIKDYINYDSINVNTKEFVITGVSINDTENKIYLSNNTLDKFMKPKSVVEKLLLQVQGEEEIKNVFENYPLDKKQMQSFTPYSEVIYSGISFMENIHDVSLFLAILFGVFAFILIINFIVVSINNNKKQIGILRALGARKMDIFKIYLYEGYLISIVPFILSIIISLLFSTYLNKLINDLLFFDIKLILFTPIVIISLILITFITIFVGVLFTSRKISKLQPVDAINNKKL